MIKTFLQKYKWRNAVKEALDNLPGGVCFFNLKGIPILCNRQMYSFAHLLMGHDLQTLEELLDALGIEGGAVFGTERQLSDGSWWSVSLHQVTDSRGKSYTEVTVFDVSDLHQKQELLREVNEAKSQTVETLERIQNNIVAITREEEILVLKTRLHNELGYDLQTIRRFYLQGCLPEEKENFLAGQREILRKLRGETDNSDEIDSLDDLKHIAEVLNMRITTSGTLPEAEEQRDLLAEALRECLINTIRHAGGDQVFLELTREERELTIRIRNNGTPPDQEIVESGGLSSLRKRVESAGGMMMIRSLPEFQLTIRLPAEISNNVVN